MWIKSFENSALKIVKKDLHLLNSSSAEIRDKHTERKEKKGFLKFEANVKLASAWSRNIKIGARLIERGTK